MELISSQISIEEECSKHISSQKIPFNKTRAIVLCTYKAAGLVQAARLTRPAGWVNRCACFNYRYLLWQLLTELTFISRQADPYESVYLFKNLCIYVTMTQVAKASTLIATATVATIFAHKFYSFQGDSLKDYISHIVTVFWKVLFAIVIPPAG